MDGSAKLWTAGRTVRRFRLLAANACVALALLLAAAGESAAADRLRILHFNDIDHAAAVPAMVTAVRQTREEADGMTLVTHGGGMLSPSLLTSLDQGRHMVELMNAVGLDYAAPGSHEVGVGQLALEERIGESEFLWLSSNLSPSLQGAADYSLMRVGTHLVGMIGLSPMLDTAAIFDGNDIVVRDPVKAAEAMARHLRRNHADLVIAIAHVDRDVDLAMLEHVDVVLSGRDDWMESHYDERGLIVQTEPLGLQLAVIDLELDTIDKDGERQFVWTPYVEFKSTSGLPPDPASLDILKAVEAEVPSEFGRIVGVARTAFDTRQPDIVQGENAFGNLVADAIREQANADVAIINAGSIRGDRVYEAGTEITLRDLVEELPYANMVSVLTISGARLLLALENGVSLVEDSRGRFPQVSGIRFDFSRSAPSGSRVRSVTVGGEPLDLARTYRLATNEYLAQGGDGYEVLSDASESRTLPVSVAEAVVAWAEARGGFEIGLDGRIDILP